MGGPVMTNKAILEATRNTHPWLQHHRINAGNFLYERIAGSIAKEIDDGLWRNGENLPSEDALTETYGVSRKTVRHALRLVERRGHIAKSQGKRSVIRCRKVEKIIGTALEFSLEAERAGLKSKTRLHGTLARQPTMTEVVLLRLPPRATVTEIKRTRYLNQLPAVSQTSILESSIASQLSNIGHPDASLYDELRKRMRINVGGAEDTLSAITANSTEAAALGIPEGTPLVSMQRKTFTDTGSVIEISTSVIRPEFFIFRFKRTA
jgi:GntR family transcriptional regulator